MSQPICTSPRIFPRACLVKQTQRRSYACDNDEVLLAASALAELPSLAAAQEVKIKADILPLAEWRYDKLYTNGISVEDLIGSDVKGPTSDNIGDVENVLFAQDGRVLSGGKSGCDVAAEAIMPIPTRAMIMAGTRKEEG